MSLSPYPVARVTPRSGTLATPPLGARSSFAIIAATFALVTLGGTLPTPLYTVWGGEFGFGAPTSTAIFAIYVLGTLLALVAFGGLSDQVGRRPLALAALALTLTSTALFVTAADVPTLLAARFLSGLGVGLITSAATAALTEVYPGPNPAIPAMTSTAANMGGLGLGSLVAGVFAEYLPAPTMLVFAVYFTLVAVVTALTLFVPETHPAPVRDHINWRPRIGVPPSSRPMYWRSAVTVFPTFTLLGLFTSLTPRFIGNALGVMNFAVAGVATFILFELGVAAQLLFRTRDPRWLILRGLPLLILALALVLTGFLKENAVLFILATAIGGIGAGLSFAGGLGQLSRAVPHGSHAKSVAAYFIAGQSGLAIPVLIIGAMSSAIGLSAATTGVIGGVILLALFGLIINARPMASTAPDLASSPATGHARPRRPDSF